MSTKINARKATFVVAADGTRLMPTFNVKKVRKLLRSGKATILSYRPYFTIKLTYTPEEIVILPSEISVDTGDQHIGISAKSEKHEYLSEQRDNLPDEKERHDAQRKIRRSRRNRLRYRKPRFNNRKKKEGWLAPSLRHKKENHVYLIQELLKVFPAQDVWLEMGTFDTQALADIEAGKPLPQGTDYQQGPRYAMDTLREAVFFRDNYTCLVCGRSAFKDKIRLHLHHIGFRYGDHSNRMGNLGTICEFCHLPVNHQPGGLLWDFEPEIQPLTGAAFMNTVRWQLYNDVTDIAEMYDCAVRMTYGTVTKRERLSRNMEKSHANDAYCIGKRHPKHRTTTRFFRKLRRNNRCLQKFYDAQYIDIRDGEVKSGSAIGCNRPKRSKPRNWDKNERIYHGRKVRKGRVSIRRQRHEIRPGDPLLYTFHPKENPEQTITRRIVAAGTHCKGASITYKDVKKVSLSDIGPMIDRKGSPIPVAVGSKCQFHASGYKPKNVMLYSINETDCTADIAWTFSAPTKDVRCLKHVSGWEEYYN